MTNFYKIKKLYPYKGELIGTTVEGENIDLRKDDKFIFEGQKYIMLNNSNYDEYEDAFEKIENSTIVKILKDIKETIPGL